MQEASNECGHLKNFLLNVLKYSKMGLSMIKIPKNIYKLKKKHGRVRQHVEHCGR